MRRTPSATARRRLAGALVATLVATLVAAPARAVPGDAATDDLAAWQTARPLAPFYERVAEDLRAGRPLVVVAHCGLWFTHEEEPERNLNWGTRYGHWRMLDRVHRGRAPHVRKVYRHAAWKRVHETARDPGDPSQPLRVVVYHQRVRPNARWQALGVTEPFDQYVAILAWSERERAAVAAVSALRRDEGLVVPLDDGGGGGGATLDLGAAQAVGYMGHNPFYDYPAFDWDGLSRIEGTPKRAKGFFAVGCNTARVPGFSAIVGPNVHVLLMSRSLMAVGGYITLALTDSLARVHTSREMVQHADRTYRYFHLLDDPDDRVGQPFVGHDFRMYPLPSF